MFGANMMSVRWGLHWVLTLAFAHLFTCVIPIGPASAFDTTAAPGIDMPGSDYRNFDLEPSIAGFGPCKAACESDARCMAWTFVKSGVQGPKARCWLKDAKPHQVRNDCCVSGERIEKPIKSTRPGGGGTPGGGSGSTGGVPAEWADMLAAHNAKRDAHCVPRLTWDAGLASAAQSWADKCTNSHAQNTGQGENLAWYNKFDGSGKSIYPAASNAQAYQDTWYCEIKWYSFKDPKWVGGSKNGCDPPVNGHFTQVVWKATTKVGCGIKNCNGSTYWVCRYSPAGNIAVDESQVDHNTAVKNLNENVKPLCK
jgi:uncharacterized protein YkwD